MSEQTIQDELYSNPVTILDKYTCLSLGATTVDDLIRSGKLAGIRVSKNTGKKPDVLMLKEDFQTYNVDSLHVKYAEVPIIQLFKPANGKAKYTKTWCSNHPGPYPIFSGNTTGEYAKISTYDYNGEYLTWVKDGLAGYLMYHNGQFSITGHRGILLPTDKCENIDLKYVRYILEPIFRNAKKGREGDFGKNEYTTLNSEMINSMNATIRIPIKADGSYDLDLQKEIARKYEKIDLIKAKVKSLSNDLNTLLVE